jgi:hypothetical protein
MGSKSKRRGAAPKEVNPGHPVYRSFRDLHKQIRTRKLRLSAPAWAILSILDQRRQKMWHRNDWVLIGYGGQGRKGHQEGCSDPECQGCARPGTEGLVELLGGKYSRRTVIAAVKELEDAELIWIDLGGGERVNEIVMPRRWLHRRQCAHPVSGQRPSPDCQGCWKKEPVRFRGGVGGRDPDGVGRANGYRARTLPLPPPPLPPPPGEETPGPSDRRSFAKLLEDQRAQKTEEPARSRGP